MVDRIERERRLFKEKIVAWIFFAVESIRM